MSTSDTKRILTRNTAWNYLGFAVNLATNLVLFPYVVHGLGDTAAGIWLLLSSITGYMGLLELGIVPSLTQTVAASLATGDRQAVSRSASTSLVLLGLLSSIPWLLTLFVPALIGTLSIPLDLRNDSVTVFRVAIIGFALRMPLATLQALLLGSQRQDRCNQLWIVIGLAKCLAAVMVIESGHGLVLLVAVEALIHVLAGGLQYVWVSAQLPDLRLSWKLANLTDARRMTAFGGTLLTMTVCSLIVEQTDRLIVAAVLPIAMVTYYAAGWKIYMLAYAVTTTLVQAVSPMAADLHGRGDRSGLADLFLKMTKYSAALAWPLVFTLALCAPFLLRVWLGEPYMAAASVVAILAVTFAVTAHNHAGHSVLTGSRRIGPTVWRYHVPQAVMNLLLSIWLVKRFGIAGVALGTMLPALALEYPFLSFVFAELGVTWGRFFREVVLRTATPAVAAFLPLMAAYWAFNRQSLLMPLTACGCLIIYAIGFWHWSLTDSERAEIGRQGQLLKGSSRLRWSKSAEKAETLAGR